MLSGKNAPFSIRNLIALLFLSFAAVHTRLWSERRYWHHAQAIHP
ncbi:hypothetical protein HanPSC8_Chr08g0331571 [Helianthus annuus]|nr:hypothetical protein HanPSC8_Chr08g0331571 [Helianthus annuus]